MKASSSYHRIVQLTDELAQMKAQLAQSPTEFLAMRIQRVERDRKAAQKLIKPTLVTGILNENPIQEDVETQHRTDGHQ